MTSNEALTLSGLTPAEKNAAAALVAVVERCSRMIATIEAMKASALAGLASIAQESGERSANPDGVDYSRRSMAAEVAAATRTHPLAAKHAMEDAETLTGSYPDTHAALASGAISTKHARVITEAGAPLDPLRRGIFDRIAAPIAAEMTAGDLARIAKKRASDMAGMSLEERHRWARKRRYVSIVDREDGMSDLRLHGPSLELHAVYDRATTLAKIVKHDRTRVRDEYRRAVGHAIDEACPDEGCRCRVLGAGRDSNVGSDAASPTSTIETSGSVHAPTGITPEAATAATDHRTLDQLRVDILADLLLGAEPTGHDLHSAGGDATLSKIHADVQVTIPVTMMIDPGRATTDAAAIEASKGTGTGLPLDGMPPGPGTNDDIASPAETTTARPTSSTARAAATSAWLGAGILVSPATVRALASRTGGWERIFYRPDTGQIERIDTYRPTAWQKRALIGRDLTCRFPGCTLPARKADIDHTHAFAEGGRTTLSNLACLCEAHHVMKHQSDWQMRQLDDGVIEWTSPTGNTYESEPPSRVFFREAHEYWDEAAAETRRATGPPPSSTG